MQLRIESLIFKLNSVVSGNNPLPISVTAILGHFGDSRVLMILIMLVANLTHSDLQGLFDTVSIY